MFRHFHQPRRRGPTKAFTLLEVLVSMAVSFVLMIALYQAIGMQFRYQDTVSQIAREAQVARTLLHRISSELEEIDRSQPASSPGLDFVPQESELPQWARELLGQGDMSLSGSNRADEFFEQPDAVARETEVSLAGTSTRLLIRLGPLLAAESMVEYLRKSRDEQNDPLASPGNEQANTGSANLFDLGSRYVFYIAAPETAGDLTADADMPLTTGDVEPNGSKDAAQTGGLLRIEFQQPHRPEVLALVQEEMTRWLSRFDISSDRASEGEDPQPADLSAANFEDAAGQNDLLARSLVRSEEFADGITAVRFRYHAGASWARSWEETSIAPLAVEVTLSFNPDARMMDLSLEQDHADLMLPSSEPVTADDAAEEPLFPFRLVTLTGQAGVDDTTMSPPMFAPTGMEGERIP